jgi:ABC-type phosphate/phosphonate transport system substrate-binding protein
MFAVLFLVGLLIAHPTMAAGDGPERRFVMGYSVDAFYDVDQKDATAALAVWSKEIGKQQGYTVDSGFYGSSAKLAEDLASGKVDFAVFRADDYTRLHRKVDFDLGMTVVKDGKKTQKIIILVRVDSLYNTLKDLRNKTLVVAKGDTVGPLYLDNLLLQQRLPESTKYFSTIQERVKASQAVLALFFGQSDACLINEGSFAMMAELNPQVKEKLRIMHASPEFLVGLGIFRKDMFQEDRATLRKTLATLGDSARGKQVLMLFKADRFDAVEPRELESVRRLIAENDKFKAVR